MAVDKASTTYRGIRALLRPHKRIISSSFETCGPISHVWLLSTEKTDARQRVIVSRNDKEEVWVATPAGNLLAACFFTTLEEVEHMGYPQLLHLYPPEEILVGPGIASEDVEEIFVEA